jgi:hypothetical protein
MSDDTPKPAPMTDAERKQAERDAKRAAGLVRKDVWAHPEDWPAIRALEAKLRARREKARARSSAPT